MKTLLRILERGTLGLLIAAILLWVGDWAVYSVRAAHGTGTDQVQVEEYLSTGMKGNKTEFDYLGTEQVDCAQALFPHGGAPACWWLRRHTTQWE
ncbi:MAG TPA: hypothetical protein VHX60_01315 [Acidobacteriaceae bacterium]|jgi:hypothetical protein|nr:hypothetical protein [Acidobacteriaceae bacterium]